MKKLETELNEIFQEYKGKYISEFDQSEGVSAKLNNQIKFTPLSFELKSKLVEKANQYINSVSKIEAEKFYSIGISEYETLLKGELNNDFNFRIEYMSSLETKGEIDKAKLELEKIDKDFPNNETVKAFKSDYKFKSKEQIIEYWKTGLIN